MRTHLVPTVFKRLLLPVLSENPRKRPLLLFSNDTITIIFTYDDMITVAF